MTGIREAKKQIRRERIFSAGIQLFNERGFEATHMETVAKQAGVAIGTLYNYYQNKGDLLLAILVKDGDLQRMRIETMVDQDGFDVPMMVRRLVEIFLQDSFEFITRDMLRRSIATMLIEPATSFAKIYQQDLERYLRSLKRVLKDQVNRGQLSAAADIEFLSEVIFNAINIELILYCLNPSKDPSPHKAKLSRTLLRLLAPDTVA